MRDVGDYVGGVKRWHYSPQRHWWLVSALFEAEEGFRRLIGYDDLPRLRAALKDAISDDERQ